MGTHVNLLTGLSHLGNYTSSNSACTMVKRMLLLGEHINKRLASLPGAIPKYTISFDLGASYLPKHQLEGRCMLCNQIHASGQLKAACYEVLCVVFTIEGRTGVSNCRYGWHGQ